MYYFTFEEHTKILGVALLGYGFSVFFGNVGTMSIWMNAPRQTKDALGAEVQIFFPVMLSLLAFWSAAVILSSAFREVLNTKSVIAALGFVFVAITSFPVGTILSSYLLVYVLVIYSKNMPIEKKISANKHIEDEMTSSESEVDQINE